MALLAADIDPNTHLPLDNLGPGVTRGAYTSAAVACFGDESRDLDAMIRSILTAAGMQIEPDAKKLLPGLTFCAVCGGVILEYSSSDKRLNCN